ncbi:GNAT family N-acetyltransferase [Rhodococcus sp. 1.20]
MYIRRETSSDRDAIYSLLGAAFADQAPPGESPYEIELTRQLFASNDYLPKLSLVAVAGDEIVGFVIGTRGWVGPVEAVGLGPLAVTPDNQRSGVGSALMHAVIGASDALDVPLLALLGSTSTTRSSGSSPARTPGSILRKPSGASTFRSGPSPRTAPIRRGSFHTQRLSGSLDPQRDVRVL